MEKDKILNILKDENIEINNAFSIKFLSKYTLPIKSENENDIGKFINVNPLKFGLSNIVDENNKKTEINNHIKIKENIYHEELCPFIDISPPKYELLKCPSNYDLRLIPNFFNQKENPNYGYNINNIYLDKQNDNNEDGVFRRKPTNMKDFVFLFIFIRLEVVKVN